MKNLLKKKNPLKQKEVMDPIHGKNQHAQSVSGPLFQGTLRAINCPLLQISMSHAFGCCHISVCFRMNTRLPSHTFRTCERIKIGNGILKQIYIYILSPQPDPFDFCLSIAVLAFA